MKVVNPFEGQPMKVCSRCGGLVQKDAPRQYINNKPYHPSCSFVQEDEDKKKALAQLI